jgi:hypothetical protein
MLLHPTCLMGISERLQAKMVIAGMEETSPDHSEQLYILRSRQLTPCGQF